MMKLAQSLRKYPIIIGFFVFLLLFSLVDMLLPAKEYSTLENRSLQQAPAFNVERFLNNEWTLAYGEYVKDQFVLRDSWITAQSALETAQGKLENNGVWYAADGYQIAKNSELTEAMQARLATNTTAVAELSQRFPGQVSAMVVPSPANVLQDKLPYNPPQMDENALLDDINAQLMAAGASVLDLRSAMASANAAGTQLFYKTDHHWTTTGGAWLAYQAFCAQQGFTPQLPQAQLVSVENFYGTNYAKTKRIGTQPDTLEYYDIQNTFTLYSYNAAGELVGEQTGVMDTAKLAEYDKYAAFLHGNNGFSVLQGDGQGSILVIKDSYGNSLVPYLTSHYAQIGIIDLRAWTEIDTIIEQFGFEDILVLYCFESFATDTNAYRMMTQAQGG